MSSNNKLPFDINYARRITINYDRDVPEGTTHLVAIYPTRDGFYETRNIYITDDKIVSDANEDLCHLRQELDRIVNPSRYQFPMEEYENYMKSINE